MGAHYRQYKWVNMIVMKMAVNAKEYIWSSVQVGICSHESKPWTG